MSVTVLSIVFRIVLLLVCGIGVAHSIYRRDGGFMSGDGIFYYTIQSNIWVLGITAVYLALSAAELATGSVSVWRGLEIARFAVMVAITITLLVFWCVLTPQMEKEYLLSLHNHLVHTLAPLLFIADFFLFQKPAPLSSAEVLWSLVLPACYMVFTLLHPIVKPQFRFENGSRYPYFFMDVDAHGWLGVRQGLGTFWWMLIMLVLTLGLGYFFRFLQTLG